MSVSSSPSWLKETPLRFEEIARHHNPPLTVYLPTINDKGDPETLPPENYEFLPDNITKIAPSDQSYKWQNLAQESGIYNQRESYPRRLLWRVIAGGTLTIHSIDSFRPKQFPRNRLLNSIQLRFPVRIRPNCIGFTSTIGVTILYVLTEDCVLYSIPLSEDVFTGNDRRQEVIMDTFRAHRPLFLQARFGQGRVSLDLPHFMSVLRDSELIVFAMQDGSLHQYNPFGISIPSISN